jgi:hypothetical protein
MSRARRRVRDDLVDVVFDVIRSAAAEGAAPGDEAAQRALAEREAARAAAKAEARRQRELRGIRSYVGAGAGLLAGGLASIALPTVAAVGIGLLAGGFANLLVKYVQTTDFQLALPRFGSERPRTIAPPEVDGRDLPKSQRDLVQGVLDDSAEHLQVIQGAAERMTRADPEAAELCRRLVAAGEKLSDAVAEEPNKFAIAQRALTYYLPRAAGAAGSLSDAPENARNVTDVRHVLTRIEMYLEKTILDMHEIDSAEMDLEMRLINQALDEDLKTGNAP